MSRYELTVGELRQIAQNILDQLEDMEADDSEQVITNCNTYGMGNHILETNAGFIDYDYIRVEGRDEDEDWDEEESE